ncbi:MAG: hypothetical protein ACLFVU_03230 [Phycisphaerae bacterium]
MNSEPPTTPGPEEPEGREYRLAEVAPDDPNLPRPYQEMLAQEPTDLPEDEVLYVPVTPGWFYRLIPHALVYPVTSHGKWIIGILVAVAVFCSLLAALSVWVGTLLLVIQFAFAPLVLTGQFMRIIESSAEGDHEMPDWFELDHSQITLFGRWLLTTAMYTCPFLLLSCFGLSEPAVLSLLVSCLLLPMAWLVVSVRDGWGGLNPLTVFKWWGLSLPAYLVILVIMLLFAVWLWMDLLAAGGFGGVAAVAIVNLFIPMGAYLMFVIARLLGVLYWTHARRLEGPDPAGY